MYKLLLCFVLLWLYHQPLVIPVSNLPISFRVTSQALGQSYDCPSACEVILKGMGNIDHCVITKDCFSGADTREVTLKDMAKTEDCLEPQQSANCVYNLGDLL